MFNRVFALAMPDNQGCEPSSDIRPRLNILVLASIPDVVQEADIVRGVANNGIDGDVAVLRADLLRSSTQLDEALKDDLKH